MKHFLQLQSRKSKVMENPEGISAVHRWRVSVETNRSELGRARDYHATIHLGKLSLLPVIHRGATGNGDSAIRAKTIYIRFAE